MSHKKDPVEVSRLGETSLTGGRSYVHNWPISIPRQRGSKYVFGPPTLTEDFFEKSPPQVKNFWGPFFQNFDGFWKKVQKINGFKQF